jgi:hypothetical protein
MKKKPGATNTFTCECDPIASYDGFDLSDRNGLKAHLEEKHGITEVKGFKKRVAHFDGETMVHNEYEWEIGPNKLKLRQFTCTPREKK